MANGWRKRLWNVARWGLSLVVLALAINFAASVFSEPLPEELLLEKATELSGWKKDELWTKGAGYGSNWIGRWSYLKLRSDKERKSIYIEMKRPLHVLGWRFSAYRMDDVDD